MLARRYVFPTCTAKPLYSLAMKERGMNGGGEGGREGARGNKKTFLDIKSIFLT